MNFRVKISSRSSFDSRIKDKDFIRETIAAARPDLEGLAIADISTKFHRIVLIDFLEKTVAQAIKQILLFQEERGLKVELQSPNRENILPHPASAYKSSGILSYKNRKVHLSNIPLSVSESDLVESFKVFGHVERAYVCDRSRRGRFQFGFVVFGSLIAANNCLNETKVLLGAEWIKVKPVKGENTNEKAHFDNDDRDSRKLGKRTRESFEKNLACDLNKSTSSMIRNRNCSKNHPTQVRSLRSTFYVHGEMEIPLSKHFRILSNIQNNHFLDNLRFNRLRRVGSPFCEASGAFFRQNKNRFLRHNRTLKLNTL